MRAVPEEVRDLAFTQRNLFRTDVHRAHFSIFIRYHLSSKFHLIFVHTARLPNSQVELSVEEKCEFLPFVQVLIGVLQRL